MEVATQRSGLLKHYRVFLGCISLHFDAPPAERYVRSEGPDDVFVGKQDNTGATPGAKTKTGKSTFVLRVDIVVRLICSDKQVCLRPKYCLCRLDVVCRHTELKILWGGISRGIR